MKQLTITDIQTDTPGAGQVTIIGEITEIDEMQPGQQVTISEFPAANRNFSRAHRLTNQGIQCIRNTSSGPVKTNIPIASLGQLAIAIDPDLSFAPVITTQPEDVAVIASGPTSTIDTAATSELDLSYQWQYETRAKFYLNRVIIASNFNDGETVTISGTVYTFKTALTPTEGQVLIGADSEESLANLKLAINRTDPGANDGVKYQIAAAHATFMATTQFSGSYLQCEARVSGSAYNGVAVATSSTNFQVNQTPSLGTPSTTTAGGGAWASATGAINGTTFADDTTDTLSITSTTSEMSNTELRCAVTNGAGTTNTAQATMTIS